MDERQPRGGPGGGYCHGNNRRRRPAHRVQATAAGVTPTNLGDVVLMPGFVEAHSHPIRQDIHRSRPHWISRPRGFQTYHGRPGVGDGWIAPSRRAEPVLCAGGSTASAGRAPVETPNSTSSFPSPGRHREHLGSQGLAFSSAVITAKNGWADGKPPPPSGGPLRHQSRRNFQRSGLRDQAVVCRSRRSAEEGRDQPAAVGGAPGSGRWHKRGDDIGGELVLRLPASGLRALFSSENVPIRVGVYQVSTDPTCGDPLTSTVRREPAGRTASMWADGNHLHRQAASFPFTNPPPGRRPDGDRWRGDDRTTPASSVRRGPQPTRENPGSDTAVHARRWAVEISCWTLTPRLLPATIFSAPITRWRVEQLMQDAPTIPARGGTPRPPLAGVISSSCGPGDLLDGTSSPR